MKSADIQQIIELSQQLAEHVDDPKPKLTRETLEELAFGTNHWFEAIVAADAEQILGFAAFSQNFELHTNSRALHISDLIVADNHRRQGVGDELLSAVRDIAAERSCKILKLEVWAENKAANTFYSERGAELIDDVKLLKITT